MDNQRELQVMDIRRPKVEEDVKTININRKGKKVGQVKAYKKSFRRLVLIGSSIALFTTGFAAGKAYSDTKHERETHIEINVDDLSRNVPTYDGIPYYIKGASTLDGIIYGYVEDANQMVKAKREIMELNGMKNTNIQYGETILLCNVPEDKLEDYGYTVNYNFFDASVEYEDRLAFLDKMKDYIERDPDLLVEIDSLHRLYEQYKYDYLPTEEFDREMDMLLEEIRDVCEDVEKNYGMSFDYHKVARPISEATRNLEVVESMGL